MMYNNSQNPTSCNHGFTLIELSIVLVIIGLIVGGILTGQDLIHAATIQKQVKQLQDYQEAFNTFRLKYNCIPGDCGNATTFFGNTDSFGNTIYNGNDNGQIDTNNGSNYNAPGVNYINCKEMWGAYQQLAAATLIDFVPKNPGAGKIGNDMPPLKLNDTTGFVFGASYNFTNTAGRNPDISSYQRGTNWLWLAMCNTSSSTWDSQCAIFTAYEAQMIDKKIDDGMPLSGSFFGFGGTIGTPNDCLNGSSYKLSNNTPQCQAAFILN